MEKKLINKLGRLMGKGTQRQKFSFFVFSRILMENLTEETNVEDRLKKY